MNSNNTTVGIYPFFFSTCTYPTTFALLRKLSLQQLESLRQRVLLSDNELYAMRFTLDQRQELSKAQLRAARHYWLEDAISGLQFFGVFNEQGDPLEESFGDEYDYELQNAYEELALEEQHDFGYSFADLIAGQRVLEDDEVPF